MLILENIWMPKALHTTFRQYAIALSNPLTEFADYQWIELFRSLLPSPDFWPSVTRNSEPFNYWQWSGQLCCRVYDGLPSSGRRLPSDAHCLAHKQTHKYSSVPGWIRSIGVIPPVLSNADDETGRIQSARVLICGSFAKHYTIHLFSLGLLFHAVAVRPTKWSCGSLYFRDQLLSRSVTIATESSIYVHVHNNLPTRH